jgi:hypothetical protein
MVVCEQCLADDMVVNEQGYFQCDQCGFILVSVMPESAELDDTPGGVVGARQIVSAAVFRRQQLESAKSAADAAAELRAELLRPAQATVADDDDGAAGGARDLHDFASIRDGAVSVPTLFEALQLVLVWHVRALAPKLGVDCALLADVVGGLWLRYVESRERLIQYRRRRRLVVPVHLRKRLRRIARETGDEAAAHRIDMLHGADIEFDDVHDRVTGTDERGRALEVTNRPRVLIVLAILWLAALHLRVGLLPCDLVRWCYDGSLPFLVAGAKFAAAQLDRAVLQGARQSLSAYKVAHTAQSLVRQLEMPPVALNMPAIVAAAVRRLELPSGVLATYALLCARFAVPPVTFGTATPLESRGRLVEKPMETYVAAHLVVALRARFGLGFDESAAHERASDFALIERWLACPPRGVRETPDFRSLRSADSALLARLASIAMHNDTFNALRSRRDAEQLLVPLEAAIRQLDGAPQSSSRSRTAIIAELQLQQQQQQQQLKAAPPLTTNYRRFSSLSSKQMHEPLLDQLLACVAWHFGVERPTLVKEVRDIEGKALFSEKQQPCKL